MQAPQIEFVPRIRENSISRCVKLQVGNVARAWRGASPDAIDAIFPVARFKFDHQAMHQTVEMSANGGAYDEAGAAACFQAEGLRVYGRANGLILEPIRSAADAKIH